MPSLLRILLVLVLSCGLASADTIRDALVNLCDPAKIATITAERGANPRVRKICYWLEMARKSGREPSTEMKEVMVNVGWGGTAKGELTADAMVRNRVRRSGPEIFSVSWCLRERLAPQAMWWKRRGGLLSRRSLNFNLTICILLDTLLANGYSQNRGVLKMARWPN
jgi:hypothetical protein